MSILIDQTKRVLVQGITGREGMARTKLMREYGTNVVAGVTPGKGGQEVEGVPVFDTIREAWEQAGPIDVSVLYIPGSNARALDKARSLAADAIIFDLEDAVADTAGDDLRVTVSEVAAPGGVPRPLASAVRRPGDVLRFHVDPLLAVKPGEGRFELRLRLTRARDQKVIDSQTAQLVPSPEPAMASAAVGEPATAPDVTTGFRAGRVPTTFAGVDFELSLPDQAGVYEVTLGAIEQGSLRWTRPLATRTLQVVAIAPKPPERLPDADWEVVYELDPGSPKLHERLRRIPTRGLPSVSVPAIPLPAMPLPSLSRPRVPLPRLPDMPLPAMPFPSVSGMVPSVSGMVPSVSGMVPSCPTNSVQCSACLRPCGKASRPGRASSWPAHGPGCRTWWRSNTRPPSGRPSPSASSNRIRPVPRSRSGTPAGLPPRTRTAAGCFGIASCSGRPPAIRCSYWPTPASIRR